MPLEFPSFSALKNRIFFFFAVDNLLKGGNASGIKSKQSEYREFSDGRNFRASFSAFKTLK